MREAAAPIATLTVMAIAMVLLVRDCKRREACEERGGRVERYNHRTIYVPTSCGSGCTIMVRRRSQTGAV